MLREHHRPFLPPPPLESMIGGGGGVVGETDEKWKMRGDRKKRLSFSHVFPAPARPDAITSVLIKNEGTMKLRSMKNFSCATAMRKRSLDDSRPL